MRTLSDYLEDSDIKQRVQSIEFKKEELILGPSYDTKDIHVINSGLVKVYNFESRGKENIAILYGPGDVFPLAWIINKKRPSVYFRAISNCSISLIPQKDFKEVLRNDSVLYDAFVKRIVEQFALFANTVNNLGFKLGRKRVCYQLLMMAVRFGARKNGTTQIPYINQSDLATMLRMSRESTSKDIAWLERQGVIKIDRPDRTHLIIKDLEFLQNEVGNGLPVIFFDNI